MKPTLKKLLAECDEFRMDRSRDGGTRLLVDDLGRRLRRAWGALRVARGRAWDRGATGSVKMLDEALSEIEEPAK